MNSIIYDYVIIGAGPSGLTSAYLLAKKGYKVIILDKAESIGGCHRVKRVDGLFAEHGPRIYSSVYLNFKQILKDMGMNFDDMFTPYKFSTGRMISYMFSQLGFYEFIHLLFAYIILIFNENYGKDTSMNDFM